MLHLVSQVLEQGILLGSLNKTCQSFYKCLIAIKYLSHWMSVLINNVRPKAIHKEFLITVQDFICRTIFTVLIATLSFENFFIRAQFFVSQLRNIGLKQQHFEQNYASWNILDDSFSDLLFL